MLRRRQSKADVLRRVPLFAGLSDQELEQVAGVADELHLPAGQELTHQGAPGREFVVVLEGEVEIERDGRPIEATGDVQFVGEMALLDNAPRNATVRTKTPSRLLVVTATDFHRLLDASPPLREQIERAAAERRAAPSP